MDAPATTARRRPLPRNTVVHGAAWSFPVVAAAVRTDQDQDRAPLSFVDDED